jgi:hypothetical protein
MVSSCFWLSAMASTPACAGVVYAAVVTGSETGLQGKRGDILT